MITLNQQELLTNCEGLSVKAGGLGIFNFISNFESTKLEFTKMEGLLCLRVNTTIPTFLPWSEAILEFLVSMSSASVIQPGPHLQCHIFILSTWSSYLGWEKNHRVLNQASKQVGVTAMLWKPRTAAKLLIVSQPVWDEFWSNASHVELAQQNALACHLQQAPQLRNIANIMDSPPTILEDSLTHFCSIFQCGAGWRPSIVQWRSASFKLF